MAEETHADAAKQPSAVVYGDVEIDLSRAIRRAFPWIQLTRALRTSFGPSKILLAIVGILLLEIVWTGLDRILPGSEGSIADSPIRRRLDAQHVVFPFLAPDPVFQKLPSLTLAEPIYVLVAPLSNLVAVDPFTSGGLQAALEVFATIVVWGLFGGAIARIAMARAGWGCGLDGREALKYAVKHFRPLVCTPLLPIIVLALAALTCAAFGLIFRLPLVGDFLGGLLLLVPMGIGLLMFAMVAGLAGSWPLMVAAVAAEGEDSLDALSRSFSYLNHRLGSYLFYLAVACAIGIPGLLLINWSIDGVLTMTRWGLSPAVPAESLHLGFPSPAGSRTAALPIPWSTGSFWIGLVRLIPRAWAYSYFWSSLSIIYLLIRKDVDGAEWSELKPDSVADEA